MAGSEKEGNGSGVLSHFLGARRVCGFLVGSGCGRDGSSAIIQEGRKSTLSPNEKRGYMGMPLGHRKSIAPVKNVGKWECPFHFCPLQKHG